MPYATSYYKVLRKEILEFSKPKCKWTCHDSASLGALN
jgi:hypothetical protein